MHENVLINLCQGHVSQINESQDPISQRTKKNENNILDLFKEKFFSKLKEDFNNK